MPTSNSASFALLYLPVPRTIEPIQFLRILVECANVAHSTRKLRMRGIRSYFPGQPPPHDTIILSIDVKSKLCPISFRIGSALSSESADYTFSSHLPCSTSETKYFAFSCGVIYWNDVLKYLNRINSVVNGRIIYYIWLPTQEKRLKPCTPIGRHIEEDVAVGEEFG